MTLFSDPHSRDMAPEASTQTDSTMASARQSASPRRRRNTAWIAVGAAHLLAAVAIYVLIWIPVYRQPWARGWWPVSLDAWMSAVLIWKTPFPVGSQEAVETLLEDRKAITNHGPEGAVDSAEGTAAARKIPMRLRSAVLVLTVMGWEILAGLAMGALALAGGAALGLGCRGGLRRVFILLAAMTAMALAVGVAWVWSVYGTGFPVSANRAVVGGLLLFLAFFGLAIGDAPRGLSALAAVLLLTSAAATWYGLDLAVRCEALDPAMGTFGYRTNAFGIHSAYGWIILVGLLFTPKRRPSVQ